MLQVVNRMRPKSWKGNKPLPVWATSTKQVVTKTWSDLWRKAQTMTLQHVGRVLYTQSDLDFHQLGPNCTLTLEKAYRQRVRGELWLTQENPQLWTGEWKWQRAGRARRWDHCRRPLGAGRRWSQKTKGHGDKGSARDRRIIKWNQSGEIQRRVDNCGHKDFTICPCSSRRRNMATGQVRVGLNWRSDCGIWHMRVSPERWDKALFVQHVPQMLKCCHNAKNPNVCKFPFLHFKCQSFMSHYDIIINNPNQSRCFQMKTERMFSICHRWTEQKRITTKMSRPKWLTPDIS